MSEKTNDPLSGRMAAADRVAAIHSIFESIRKTLTFQVSEMRDGLPTTPKALMAKLSELQTAQLMLSKAEDAFAEKYGRDEDDADIDYDQLRDQIGRKLDRIRTSGNADDLFKEPDAS